MRRHSASVDEKVEESKSPTTANRYGRLFGADLLPVHKLMCHCAATGEVPGFNLHISAQLCSFPVPQAHPTKDQIVSDLGFGERDTYNKNNNMHPTCLVRSHIGNFHQFANQFALLLGMGFPFSFFVAVILLSRSLISRRKCVAQGGLNLSTLSHTQQAWISVLTLIEVASRALMIAPFTPSRVREVLGHVAFAHNLQTPGGHCAISCLLAMCRARSLTAEDLLSKRYNFSPQKADKPGRFILSLSPLHKPCARRRTRLVLFLERKRVAFALVSCCEMLFYMLGLICAMPGSGDTQSTPHCLPPT